MKIKIPFLVVVAVALFGISAASASASTFLAEKYPVLVKALSTNVQGFEITGAVSVCEDAHFMTGEAGGQNPSGPSEMLLIHPTYLHCHVSIAGATLVPAAVLTTGCNFVFHAALSETKNGTVDIECETGKSIQIELTTLGGSACTISVNGTGNVGLKEVLYLNEAGGKVKVNANVSKVTWSAASTCGLTKTSGTEAIYREGKVTSDKAEMGTGPASAIAEGKFGASVDEITVD
jgi:hypothetical protein